MTPPPAVRLASLTRAGRNHLANHGDTWTILDARSSVPFSDVPGPWLLLESIKDREAGKDLRSFAMWVLGDGDGDYRVIGHPEASP